MGLVSNLTGGLINDEDINPFNYIPGVGDQMAQEELIDKI